MSGKLRYYLDMRLLAKNKADIGIALFLVALAIFGSNIGSRTMEAPATMGRFIAAVMP